MLVVVDTHRPSYVEAPELLSQCSRIVVIDHHRRSAEFIDNSSLLYHEPYASSACEMVTEILQYLDEKGKPSREEAEALLSGIFLDTKSFTLKTGVRTFEASAYLRRAGADTGEAKRLFQSDLGGYKERMALLANASEYKEGIVIAYADDHAKMSKEVVAQAADELMGASDVEAIFHGGQGGRRGPCLGTFLRRRQRSGDSREAGRRRASDRRGRPG